MVLSQDQSSLETQCYFKLVSRPHRTIIATESEVWAPVILKWPENEILN